MANSPNGPQPNQGQPASFSFSFAGSMNPPNFVNNQFGGNVTGQAAQAGPHGGGNPFATAGANMPQFGGGGTFSFGGGQGGIGDSIKNLIKSNTDLVTALKDLTKAVKGGGIGDGPPGMGPAGGGGGLGGGLGGSALDRQLLYGARGAGQRIPGSRLPQGGLGGPQSKGDALLNYTPHGNFNNAGFDMSRRMGQFGSFEEIQNDPGLSPQDRIQHMQEQRDFNANLRSGFDIGAGYRPSFGQGIRGFFRGVTKSPLHLGAHISQMRESQLQGIADNVGGRFSNAYHGGQSAGVMLGQNAVDNFAYQSGAQAGQSFRSFLGSVAHHQVKNAARGGRDFAFRLGASSSLIDIAAATPFIGGALAAPLSTLQNLGMKSAVLELPSAIMSGFGLPGTAASGQGAITTHNGLITNMATTFGIDAAGALQMGNNLLMQGSGGFANNDELFGSFVQAMGQGFDSNIFGINARMRLAGSNLTKTMFGDKQRMNAFAMAQGMGLKGVAATELVQGIGGLGAQFRGMGIDLNMGLSRDIEALHRSGFSSLGGLGAVEGAGRIRSKTSIAASQSLGGMFAGIGNDLLLAQAISESGGDLDKAAALLEGQSVRGGVSMLRRATGMKDGDPVFEMIQMGQNLTVAERRALQRKQRGQVRGRADISGLGAAAKGLRLSSDIDISSKIASDTNEMLETFQTGKTEDGLQFTEAFKQLTDQNKAIEKKLIEGINVNDFDKIVLAAGEINDKLRYVPKVIDALLGMLGL